MEACLRYSSFIKNEGPKKRRNISSITPALNLSSSYFPAQQDQDLDSLKLSIQSDVAQGYRNALRFKSNYYKKFFNKVENDGFKRLSTEITNLYKLPKVLRTLKVESKSRIKNKSLLVKLEEVIEKPAGNELVFLMELKKCPKSVLPKVRKAKIKKFDEIEEFEEKLRDLAFGKRLNSRDLYQTKKVLIDHDI